MAIAPEDPPERMLAGSSARPRITGSRRKPRGVCRIAGGCPSGHAASMSDTPFLGTPARILYPEHGWQEKENLGKQHTAPKTKKKEPGKRTEQKNRGKEPARRFFFGAVLFCSAATGRLTAACVLI